MAIVRVICIGVVVILASNPAFAQDSGKPLNLTLPPTVGFHDANVVSAAPASTTSGNPASASTGTPSASTNAVPGEYSVETTGANVDDGTVNNPNDATASCDNKPQVHGSVGTGVVASRHFSGNYQTGRVNITKPLGDCKHPSGSLSISVGASQGRFSSAHGSH